MAEATNYPPMNNRPPDEVIEEIASRANSGETYAEIIAWLFVTHGVQSTKPTISRWLSRRKAKLEKTQRESTVQKAADLVQANADTKLPDDLAAIDALIRRARFYRVKMAKTGDLRGAVMALKVESELLDKRIDRATGHEAAKKQVTGVIVLPEEED